MLIDFINDVGLKTYLNCRNLDFVLCKEKEVIYHLLDGSFVIAPRGQANLNFPNYIMEIEGENIHLNALQILSFIYKEGKLLVKMATKVLEFSNMPESDLSFLAQTINTIVK